MWKEFKEFAVKGNALDLAIGVIIGAAFGKIVTSLVDDIIMPPLGFVVGRIDFSSLFITLNAAHYASLKAAKDAGAPVIAYGNFLNNVLNFLIVAFAIFLIVKQINRFKRGEEEKPEGKLCPYCKQSIAIDATRCPHCTSQIEAVTAAAAAPGA
jgi:large conductance mechanosensitive channel